METVVHIMARVEGIEPPLSVLETEVLPLNDTRIFRQRRRRDRCFSGVLFYENHRFSTKPAKAKQLAFAHFTKPPTFLLPCAMYVYDTSDNISEIPVFFQLFFYFSAYNNSAACRPNIEVLLLFPALS